MEGRRWIVTIRLGMIKPILVSVLILPHVVSFSNNSTASETTTVIMNLFGTTAPTVLYKVTSLAKIEAFYVSFGLISYNSGTGLGHGCILLCSAIDSIPYFNFAFYLAQELVIREIEMT